MKKVFKYFSLILACFIFLTDTVFAADYSVYVTSNTVTVGNSVTLRIDGTESSLTGRFNISSSNTSLATVSNSSVWVENNVQTVTVNTKGVGKVVITVTPAAGTSDGNGNEPKLSSKTVTITINAKQTTASTAPKPKSSNNFLSSLTVDRLKLEEDFDKEVLEYNVTVPAETEKIKINAQLADSSAKVVGIGEVIVSEGINIFEIVVTAENGSKRTYTLKANVLELEPVLVNIDGYKYTVVRKRKDLPKISDYFSEKDILVDEETIEGYYNEKLNYSVLGLKDSNGNIEYYIYDNGKYTLYKEYTFGGTTLQVLDKELDGRYKKTNFVYDNDKINSYQEVKPDIIKNTYALDTNQVIGNKFYLFYAKNVENGNESLYQYDAVEKTIQRYNLELLDMYKDVNNIYYLVILGLVVFVILLIMIYSILINRVKKKNKNKKKKLVKNTMDFIDDDE